MTQKELYILIGAVLIVVIQGTWIFTDASKRGENKWIWGIFGLIHCPGSLIIYLLITRIINKQIICPHCLYAIKLDSNYCAYCGEVITEDERLQGSHLYQKQEKKNN